MYVCMCVYIYIYIYIYIYLAISSVINPASSLTLILYGLHWIILCIIYTYTNLVRNPSAIFSAMRINWNFKKNLNRILEWIRLVKMNITIYVSENCKDYNNGWLNGKCWTTVEFVLLPNWHTSVNFRLFSTIVCFPFFSCLWSNGSFIN